MACGPVSPTVFFVHIFVFHWPCSPSQHEKVMNMGVMRIPEFDKFYRVKVNEFFEPYSKFDDRDAGPYQYFQFQIQF